MQEPLQSSRPSKGNMKFPTQRPKVLESTIQNVIATATRLQVFVHSWASILLGLHVYLHAYKADCLWTLSLNKPFRMCPQIWSRVLSFLLPAHVGRVAVTKHTRNTTKEGKEGIT